MQKKAKKVTLIFILSLLFVFSHGNFTMALTTKSTTIEREFEYSGMVSNNAIQSFDYGNSNEVFSTQRSGSTTILTRCIMSEKTCNKKDYVKLANFGHGESLEVIKENGRTFIWIGNTANLDTSYNWSTEISLIEYIIDPTETTGARIANVKTIKNLAKVAPEVSGTAYRSAVAIADGSDRISFRIQIGTSASNTYYAVYRLSEVTSALRASSTNSLNIYNLNSLQLTHFTGLARPNNSFQGFDITGVGTGNKFLYLFGGAVGETPMIYKYSYTNGGNYEHLATYKIKGSYVGSLEAEGIKVEKDRVSGADKVFIGLKPGYYDNGDQKPFRTYSLIE